MLSRRRFLLTSLAGALAAPVGAGAQRADRVYKIGYLSYRGCGVSLDPKDAFQQGLRDLGYIEGRNLVIECRDAVGRVDRFPDLATELVRLKIEILAAESTPASLAAKQATITVPIVMLNVGDPVRSGLVGSLARPGGNITGVALFPTLEVVPKVLEHLKAVAPHASRVSVLQDPTNSGQVVTDGIADTTARALGMQLQRVPVRSAADLPAAFSMVQNQRAQALFVYPMAMEKTDIKRIADFAVTSKLPATTLWDGYAEQGFLLFYGSSVAQQGRQAGVYIDKIIKGARPSDLPVEQPTKFELIINLKTARALGITMPPSLLARVDQVIDP